MTWCKVKLFNISKTLISEINKCERRVSYPSFLSRRRSSFSSTGNMKNCNSAQFCVRNGTFPLNHVWILTISATFLFHCFWDWFCEEKSMRWTYHTSLTPSKFSNPCCALQKNLTQYFPSAICMQYFTGDTLVIWESYKIYIVCDIIVYFVFDCVCDIDMESSFSSIKIITWYNLQLMNNYQHRKED